jgi:hypothetical protein
MRLVAILAVLIFSSNALAGSVVTTGKVTTILNWEGHGGHLIKVEHMGGTSSICSRNDYYILSKEHPFVKENYSLLLSARISGTPVTLRLSDASSKKCQENFPRIFHVQI